MDARIMEKAILAGGCFWGMEEIIRAFPGVVETRVGYIGGDTVEPTYQEVCTGRTGHAEAVEITFDPQVISYKQLLLLFFKMHDPTTKNRQHNDIGTQYRSTIFVTDEMQAVTAQQVIEALNVKNKFGKPVVTTIEEAGPFYEAETYHQDYLIKNPGGYNCHIFNRNLDLSDI